MASHEFRTPLSTVLSSAALIGKYTQTEDQDKRDRHIKKIKDSVKHLNDLLEDFLSLGKLAEGKIRAKCESFELKPFLEETAEELEASIKNGQVIIIKCPDDSSFITDKKLLRNILINLLSNAVKFSDEKGNISVTALVNEQNLTIAVCDSGVGIPEEDQQYMFTSFYRGKNATNIQGTGLGLHIVKRYVELLKGNISFESDLGKGTTFTIELPELLEE